MCLSEPKPEYEKYRRRITLSINFFWDHFKHEVKKLKEEASANITKLNMFFNLVRTQKLLWLSDLEQIRKYDGFDPWRVKEASILSNTIFNRFNSLQNPTNCSTNKFLRCSFYFNSGWGKMKHLIYFSQCTVCQNVR